MQVSLQVAVRRREQILEIIEGQLVALHRANHQRDLLGTLAQPLKPPPQLITVDRAATVHVDRIEECAGVQCRAFIRT